MSSTKKNPRKPSTNELHMKTLSAGAHALAAHGSKTEDVVSRYFAREVSANAYLDEGQEDLRKLAQAFNSHWNDSEAATVVEAYGEAVRKRRRLHISSLQRWIRAHPNEPAAVIDCMNIDPPPEITITRVLSRAGSQKLVFLATWLLTQREVVLKKVTGSPELIDRIVARESQSHPLSTVHDNIIKTHELRNAAGERFLVEERLPVILNDAWRSHGSGEAANLLYDIASALNYLHTELDWVHGDVKPDNIGQKESRYILLDFGICRPAAAFTLEATATGSLRTRAPELLVGAGYLDPKKVDIWALGATVFNAIQGRYPLFEPGEKPPRISTPEERSEFENKLAERVSSRWSELVDLREISEPLKGVLAFALEQDPEKRNSANQLLKKAESELSVFLRRPSSVGPFSPLDELQQLRDYLPRGSALKLMPLPHRNLLQAKLKDLQRSRGLSAVQKSDISQLLALIS